MDYPSLEVVEMAVRSRIDELEEWCFWCHPFCKQGLVNIFSEIKRTSAPSPEYSDSLDSTISCSYDAKIERIDSSLNKMLSLKNNSVIASASTSEEISDSLRKESSLINKTYRVLSEDYYKNSKSPEIKNSTTHCRDIQSAKGTWTYNF